MIKVPEFATEAEEAGWWYANREEHSAELAEEVAAAQGRRGGIVPYLAELERARNVVLEHDDAIKAARLAVEKGVDVKLYLSELVHQALTEETERAA